MTLPDDDPFAFNDRANELRRVKADKLARILHEQGVTSGQALFYDEDQQKIAERVAGVRTSHRDDLWVIVLELLDDPPVEWTARPVCPDHGPMRETWVDGHEDHPETTGDLWVCVDEDCDHMGDEDHTSCDCIVPAVVPVTPEVPPATESAPFQNGTPIHFGFPTSPGPLTRDCGCPLAGVVRDQVKHREFHDRVEEQTGIPWGQPLHIESLRAARGMKTEGANDHKGREKNLKAGKSSPGWRREAAR